MYKIVCGSSDQIHLQKMLSYKNFHRVYLHYYLEGRSGISYISEGLYMLIVFYVANPIVIPLIETMHVSRQTNSTKGKLYLPQNTCKCPG